jgi:hypothetical protein
VRHARDWVCGTSAIGVLPTKAQTLKLRFDLGVNQLAPLLEEMSWTIEECAEPSFATCDATSHGTATERCSTPRLIVGLDDMRMNEQRLTFRFSGDLLADDNGPTGREVLHNWTPIRDDAWGATSGR